MKYLRLLLFIIGCELIGVFGSMVTAPAIETWYVELVKPSFNPPNWIFGPVWTTLYALMGIAAWLVFEKGWNRPGVKTSLVLFDTQLLFNLFWSYLFFGLRSPLLAFIDLIVLWILILTVLVLFYKISRPAGLLMVPYILWVSFAGILNFCLYWLNR